MNLPTTGPGTLARARTPIAAIARRIAVISALAVAVFALSGSVASAGSDESIATKKGFAAFNDRGEILVVEDKLEDGVGIQAALAWKGRFVTVIDGKGGDSIPNSKNLKIPEGTRVKLQLRYFNKNGVVFKRSRPQRATA